MSENRSELKILKNKETKDEEEVTLKGIFKKINNLTKARRLLIMFSLGMVNIDKVIAEFRVELKKMNRKKVGRKFTYPDSFIMYAGILQQETGLPFRKLHKELKKQFSEFEIPSSSTLHDRMSKLKVDACKDMVSKNTAMFTFIIDATGFSQFAGKLWIDEKNNKKRKGFVKLHILIDLETQAILSFSVTTDKTADSSQFKTLVNDGIEISERINTTGKKLKYVAKADKGYDTAANHKHCEEEGITDHIAIKINAKSNGNTARNKQARTQLCYSSKSKNSKKLSKETCKKNQKEWMEAVGYGQRSLVEAVFSAMKRMFGEKIRAKKMGKHTSRNTFQDCSL